MIKKIKIFNALDEKPTPENLASKMIERRLGRRVMMLERSPEVTEWVETAVAMWKMGRDEDDFLDELRNRPTFADYPHYPRRLSTAEQDRYKKWARSWCARLKGSTLSSRLSKPDRDELIAASRGMHVQYMTEHDVDVAFSSVHKEYPWLEALTERAWRHCLLRVRRGRPAGVGPLLISGPPGLGKSSWSRAVSAALRVPSIDVDVGVSGGVHELQGSARGWSSADKGRVIGTLISERIANPVVVLDEIDAGSARVGTTNGSLPGIFKVLMSMIEPSTARRWVCPFFQVPFDLTHISWIATCNDHKSIDQPLLDRMSVIEIGDMTREQLIDFGRRQAAERLDDAFGDLIAETIDKSTRSGQRLSLRHVIRMIDKVVEASERPILH